MIVTFGELRQEVADRGLHHLGTTRLGNFVEQAAMELHFKELWDFRRMVETGPAPLAAATMEGSPQIKHVRDTASGARLWPVTESELLDRGSGGGAANEYWAHYEDDWCVVERADGTTGELTVVFYSGRPWNNGGLAPASLDDWPESPQAFRDLIVELAVARGLRDDGREDEAEALEGGVVVRRLEDMRAALLRSTDEPKRLWPESLY